MPPMLHVAFAELMRRAAQQMLAGEARLSVQQRHDVLQLIAEAERTARLVMAAARPEAARQRLVEEPAVYYQVEGAVRGLDLYRAQGALPVLLHRAQRLAGLRRCAAAHAQRKDDLALLPVREIEGHLQRAAGIEPRAHLVRK